MFQTRKPFHTMWFTVVGILILPLESAILLDIKMKYIILCTSLI